jgi:hypothetical protein
VDPTAVDVAWCRGGGVDPTVVEAVGEDPTVVSEAVAWARLQWRRRGVEVHTDGGVGARREPGDGRGGGR